MKSLIVHNNYKTSGGELTVVKAEITVLQNHRIETNLLEVTNDNLIGIIKLFNVARTTCYSTKSKEFLLKRIDYFRPDIVHVHNFFPLLTPSIYDACIEAGVPVVQTLHNYRTLCPGALLMRKGEICEKCLTGSPYQAILHRCYRDSIPGTWAVARMVAYHRRKRTWQHKVNRFIALTQFAKQKFVQAGFPERNIFVKPNFCQASVERVGLRPEKRNGALFVGRLSEEKGVTTLLDGWRGLDIPLRVAGDGPLLVENRKRHQNNIEFLGRLTGEQVKKEMSLASFLVMPSEWYEGFPMVLVEAFANGLPVVVSRLGSMAEIVEDGKTGLHFEPGNPQDLAQKVQWMHEHLEECRIMGNNAKKVFEEKYTPEKNYEMLMDVYRQAINEKRKD